MAFKEKPNKIVVIQGCNYEDEPSHMTLPTEGSIHVNMHYTDVGYRLTRSTTNGSLEKNT